MDRVTKVKAWLAELWAPAVSVIVSPEADALCQAANGLSVVSLLRPFGVLAQLNGSVGVPVRTVGEAPFRLHSWRLRFYAGSTMFQPPPEVGDPYLKSVLSAAAAAACDDDVPDVETLLQPGGADATPWYGMYRDEFLRMLAFGDHEAMDHPVACVLVLPSTIAGDPVAAFEELFARSGALPPLMQAGVMEPRIPKHYVFLHDARSAPPGGLERAQALLRQLAASLGPSVGQQCHLLAINSRTPEQPAGMESRFWGAARPGTVPGGGAGEPAEYLPLPPGVTYGAGLNERDVAGVAEFVRGLAVHHIIPNLEQRIRVLNHQVTSTRKGLRNQLKSLLWRKAGSSTLISAMGGASDSPASTAPSTPTGSGSSAQQLPGAYLHSSVEGEMRALGDLALALRDSETALSTLRLLASDFKQDKAWKHYAAVQEALGVATILSGGSPADAIANFKEAFYRYQQVAQLGGRHRGEGTRYATRTAMLLIEYLRAIGQHGEATWVAMKAHFQEENLRAGLLLEQAAHSLLRLTPRPHVRKFAFHLVLAGLRYNMCDQKGLALRAYKQVLGVYQDKKWALIEEHLHDVLGRQSREAGDWLGAVQHCMAMVNCPANSLYCQRAYLAQFLDVLRTAQAQLGFEPALELPVPEFNLEQVGLQYDSQTGYGTAEARQVRGEVWRPLEAAVQPPTEGGPLTWLDGGSRANMAHQQPEHTCVVGETVGIDVEVFNPLQVELAITRLRLACSFEPALQPGAAAAEAAAAAGNGPGPPQRLQPAGLQIREENVTLAGGERMVVHLRLVPLKAGTLSVEGLQWVLNGVAQGHQRLRIPRPKPRKPGTSKPLLDAERPPPGGVSFTVLPPMPHLEVTSPPLPPGGLVVGELLRCPLRLRNRGAMTTHNIALAVGTPDILLTAVEVVEAADEKGPAAEPAAAPRSAPSSPPPPMTSSGLCGASSPAGAAAAQQLESSGDVRVDVALSQQLEGLAVDPAGLAAGSPPQPAPAAAAAAAAPLGLPPKGPRRPAGRGGGVVEVVATERPGGVTVFSLPPGSSKLGVGQELHLLLWLRPSREGVARFNCVWCYEPVVKLDSLKFRTLRTTHSALVHPSLGLAAAAVGGRSTPGAALLQLRAQNLQGVDAFRLRQLACPGGAWQLNGLQPAEQPQPQADGLLDVEQQQQEREWEVTGGSSSSSQELDVVVAPEAAATLHYRLTPAVAAAAAAAGGAATAGAAAPVPVMWAVEQPPSGLLGDALADAVVGWFVRRSHPAAKRRQQLAPAASTASMASLAGSTVSQQPAQLGPAGAGAAAEDGGAAGQGGLGGELSAALDLVLQWEAVAAAPEAPPRSGFHVLYQQRVAEGPPIHVQLVGPTQVAHDFETAPFATLRLVLRVHNTLPAPAAVCIEAGKQPDGKPTQLGMPTWAAAEDAGSSSSSSGWVQPMRPYVWVGRTRAVLTGLAGGQTVEVPLQVATAGPGTLSLSDYMVSWSFADTPALSGSRPGAPWVVTVQQQQQQVQPLFIF